MNGAGMGDLVANFVIQVLSGLVVVVIGGLLGDFRGKKIRGRIARRLPEGNETSGTEEDLPPKSDASSTAKQSIKVRGHGNAVTQQSVNNQISIINKTIENRSRDDRRGAGSDTGDELIVGAGVVFAILAVAVILLGYLPWIVLLFWVAGVATAAVASYLYVANRRLTEGDQEGRDRGRSTFVLALLGAASSIMAGAIAPNAKSPSYGADRSLAEVSAAIGQYSGPDDSGLSETVDRLLDYVGNAFGYIGNHHPIYLLIQASAFVLAGALVFGVWAKILDWLGYMSAMRADMKGKRRPSKRVSSKAASFLQDDVSIWRLGGTLVLAVGILLLSSGLLFELGAPVLGFFQEWASK